MATEAALRRRIRELNDRLDALSREHAASRSEMERRMGAELRRMQDELKRALEDSRRRMDAEYSAQVRKLRESLQLELQRFADELRRADEEANRERQRIIRELEQANEELRREFEKLREKEHERSEKGLELSRERTKEAQARIGEIELLPHGFFCPHELDVFREHLGFARDLIDTEMYEAAVATVDTALTELQIFELKVREKQHEWEELYDEYARLVRSMHEALTAFEATVFKTALGDVVLTDELRAFWSSGGYGTIRDRVESFYELVRRVEEEGGVTACLKEGGAPTVARFLLQLPELRQLMDHLTAVMIYTESELCFSAARCYYGQLAADVAGQLGYEMVSSAFRGEDPMDSYDVIVSANGRDMVQISFVPERRDGVVVNTICLVSAEYVTTPEPELTAKTAGGVASALQRSFEERSLRVSVRGCPLRAQAKTLESRSKQKPDVTQLAKSMERKYR